MNSAGGMFGVLYGKSLMAQANSETNLFPYNTPNMSPAEFILHTPTCLQRWNTQSVQKRRHIKFRLQGITPKESIQHSEHGKILKSRTLIHYFRWVSSNYNAMLIVILHIFIYCAFLFYFCIF